MVLVFLFAESIKRQSAKTMAVDKTRNERK